MNPLTEGSNTHLLLLADKYVQPRIIEFFRNRSFDVLSIEKAISNEDMINAVDNIKPSFVLSVNLYRYPPEELFMEDKCRWINLHFGKLPGYAGAYPVQRAVIHGETEVGITLNSINSYRGSIGIIGESATPVFFNDTGYSVSERCIEIGESLIDENLRDLLTPNLKPSKNSPTWAKIWNRAFDDLKAINWNRTAFEIHNQIRSFSRPYEGVSTVINGKRTIIWDSELSDPFCYDVTPGTILNRYKRTGLEVATGSGTLRILEFEVEKKWDLCKGDCFANLSSEQQIYEGV